MKFSTKPGLIVYLTAGDPSLEATYDIALATIDNGADVLELGVPFSDPLMQPTASSHRKRRVPHSFGRFLPERVGSVAPPTPPFRDEAAKEWGTRLVEVRQITRCSHSQR